MSTPLPFDPISEAARQWTEHWGPDPVPSMTAVTSIMRAQQVLLARLNAMLVPFDLTFARYEALMLLYYSREGELPLGKLSERLQVHKASVTNVVNKLVSDGYVERTSHESDGRTVLGHITSKGRHVAERATAVLNEAEFGMEPTDTGSCNELFALLEPLRRGAGDFSD
jgi:DNA-binding MarR family transcriptional regulator